MTEYFDQKRYEFILEASEPIAHHEGSIGNHAVVMRKKVRLPDGTWANVPIITSDTMRHKLRESSALAILAAAGMLGPTSLSEAAIRLLFAGGMVTGSAGGSVKFDTYRELCDLVPTMAIFGGCAQNRVVPGRLSVGEATLICGESAHLIPKHAMDWVHEHGGEVDTARAHIEEVQRVRMDPMLNPANRLMLTAGEQVAQNEKLRLSEKASEDQDHVAKADAKSTMLPRTFERVCCGSLFYWSIDCTLMSDLDADVFDTAVLGFLGRAKVGGKQGTGHGLLNVRWSWQHSLKAKDKAPDVFDSGKLSLGVGKILKAHMEERKDRVREFLRFVEA